MSVLDVRKYQSSYQMNILHPDPYIAKLLKQANIRKSNPRYLLQKLLKDIEDLERFYKDKADNLEYSKLEKHRKARREA